MDSFVQQIAGIKISVKGVPIKLKKAKINSLVVAIFHIHLKYNNNFKTFKLPKHPSVSHVCIIIQNLPTNRTSPTSSFTAECQVGFQVKTLKE